MFCPVKSKSPSQKRREEARRNKYCLCKSIQVSVEKIEDKKFTDKTKASEVIKEVFEKWDEPNNVSIEETVDIKFSDKMKASEVIEEVFVKSDNYGKNFKTKQDLKDHCDQAHQYLQKGLKYKCDQCNYQNIN